MFGKCGKEGIEARVTNGRRAVLEQVNPFRNPGPLVQLDERERETDGFGLPSGAVRPSQTGLYRLRCLGERPGHTHPLLSESQDRHFMILQTHIDGTDNPNQAGLDGHRDGHNFEPTQANDSRLGRRLNRERPGQTCYSRSEPQLEPPLKSFGIARSPWVQIPLPPHFALFVGHQVPGEASTITIPNGSGQTIGLSKQVAPPSRVVLSVPPISPYVLDVTAEDGTDVLIEVQLLGGFAHLGGDA